MYVHVVCVCVVCVCVCLLEGMGVGNEEKTGGACSWVLNHRGETGGDGIYPQVFHEHPVFFPAKTLFLFFSG